MNYQLILRFLKPAEFELYHGAHSDTRMSCERGTQGSNVKTNTKN